MGSEPITNNQTYFLKSKRVDSESITKLEATKIISEIKKSNNVIQNLGLY